MVISGVREGRLFFMGRGPKPTHSRESFLVDGWSEVGLAGERVPMAILAHKSRGLNLH